MSIIFLFFAIIFGYLVFLLIKKLKKYKQAYSSKTFFNAGMQAENLRKLDDFLLGEAKASDRKKILYIADFFEIAGGAESRIKSQIDYLQDHGWDCCILTQYTKYVPLFETVNLHLNFLEPSFGEYLFEIVKKGKFDCVEFVFKGWKHISKINLDELKKTCRIGCFICNLTDMPDSLANKFDYRVSISERIGLNPICIRNWITYQPEECWKFNHQTSALFISRIDSEKLPTLKNFLDICEKYAITPIVAGPVQSNSFKVLRQLRRVPTKNQLSVIKTIDFLKKNHNHILFVAGVGQVPLEAISLGYPALVLTHRKQSQLSTFITVENINFLSEWNFVIKRCPVTEIIGNVDAFFEYLNKYQDISKFIIPREYLEQFGIETAMRKYLAIIDGSTSNQIMG